MPRQYDTSRPAGNGGSEQPITPSVAAGIREGIRAASLDDLDALYAYLKGLPRINPLAAWNISAASVLNALPYTPATDGQSVIRLLDLLDRPSYIMDQSASTKRPLYSSGYLAFDGSNDNMIGPLYHVQETLPLLSATTLPDLPTTTPSAKGFSDTGLCKDPNGSWWIGHSGRNQVGDTYNPSIANVSADGSTLLVNFPMKPQLPALEAVQGVAYDLDVGTLYITSNVAAEIYEVNKTTGVIIRTITVAAIINGICYDRGRGCLWGMQGNGYVRQLNKTTGATIAVFEGNPNSDSSDHVFYDEVSKLLYHTWGASGANGHISALDTVSGGWLVDYITLDTAIALEGLWIDASGLTVCSNEYYHAGGANTNKLKRYDWRGFTNYAESVVAGITICFRGKITSTPVRTCCLIGVGNPGVSDCAAIYMSSGSTTTLRCQVSGIAGATQVVNTSTTAAALTTDSVITLVCDFAAKTARFYQNGAAIGSSISLSAMTGNSIHACGLIIGGNRMDLTERACPLSLKGYSVFGSALNDVDRLRAEALLTAIP